MLPSDEERAALARELDVPPGCRLDITDSGTAFGDYALQYFGVQGGDPSGSPWWGYGTDGNAMQVRMIQIRHRRGAVGLERRWHPERGLEPLMMICPSGRFTREDYDLVWRVRDELQEEAGRGRPRGSLKGDRWTRQDFIDWYREDTEAYARDGVRITLKILGAELGGLSADTAKTRLVAVGLPWPPWSYPDLWDPDPDE
jgi:hypothetical protein